MAAHSLASRDPEVRYLDLASPGNEHVGRAQVGVHHRAFGPLVGEGHAVAGGLHHLHRQVERQRTRAQELPQVGPVDVLEDQEDVVAGATQVEDGDEVRVLERDEQLRLADQALHEALVARKLRPQALDGDHLCKPVSAPRPRPVDFPHSAGSKQIEELIALRLHWHSLPPLRSVASATRPVAPRVSPRARSAWCARCPGRAGRAR